MLRDAFNAWLLDVLDGWFHHLLGHRKAALLGGLRGTVVELGPGAGSNLRYYDPSVRLIAVEPAVGLHDRLRERAAARGIAIELHAAFAERAALPDAVADAVVGTLVLCSVRDVDQAVATALRVLKPGGAFVFLEHVAAPRGTWLRRAQGALRGPWRWALAGCTPDRETWRNLEAAGFADVQIEHFTAPTAVWPIRPQIVGVARKAPAPVDPAR